jgi:peptidase S46-like protein
MMMKKAVYLFLLISFSFGSALKADEGMWIPSLVEKLVFMEMQKMGLELTADEIYNVNNSSLKDAIVIFGGGCTGEIISPEGLILTNHHCGYGSIQGASTPENNILKNGFWAMNKKEEIPIDGLKVTFLKEIIPATDEVLAGVTDEMTEEERYELIDKNIKAIEEAAQEGNDYKVTVRSFFEGNQYYTFLYEVFTDVRLVGAPPEAIGKFGSDTDNWMWPRHTGDFSMFRVYTAPDGSPAKYAEENKPMIPKHFLPINISGIEDGEFAMIMGYPGGTDRYMTSFGVDQAIEQNNPTVVKIRAKLLANMDKYMETDTVVRLQYSSKHARKANYWKYFIGQTKGLKALKVSEKKRKIESDFNSWVAQSEDRKAKYGEALNDIEKAYQIITEYAMANTYFFEGIYQGPEIMKFSFRFRGLLKDLKNKEVEEGKVEKDVEKLKASLADYFKNYSENVDKDQLASMLRLYFYNVPSDQQPEDFKKIANKYNADFVAFANDVFEKSIFANEARVTEFLNKPKAKTIEKDMVYKLMNAFYRTYRELSTKTAEADDLLEKGKRLFVAGLMEMQPDKKFYPDANFTMRLSYGIVDDYYPADAVHFNYFTTLDGVMQKEDASTWEFQVPAKLKKLYEAKDYGQYGENGELKVCFLTNHDITGGNSGSPVINGKGELIGLAFDGNWEAMSGDIAFEPELQRTINVDIRYVLFIIDKFGGAENLIKEMKITKSKPQRKIGPAEVQSSDAVVEIEITE